MALNQRKPKLPTLNSLLFNRKLAPYLFILPFFGFFLLFGAFPTLFSVFLSFHEWSPTQGFGAMTWNGVENYSFTLTDPLFWKAVSNTLILGLYGLAIQPFAIALAYFIHTALKYLKQFVLGIYFLPYITSTVAVAIVFSLVFSERAGLLNAILGGLNTVPLLGLIIPDTPVDWLGNPATIKPSIAILLFWRFLGWNTLLFLTALEGIPQVLYEAAEVDGATAWQRFWHVTLPLLRPMLFLTVTLTIIGQIQLFDEPFILTDEGGPGKAGLTIATYLYITAFRWNDPGTAAAISWYMFLLMAAVNVLNAAVFRGGRARG